MGGKAKNIEKPLVFIVFLHFWEARKRCIRHLRGCLERFRNIFGHDGDKMESKREKMATKRATMATKSAQDPSSLRFSLIFDPSGSKCV